MECIWKLTAPVERTGGPRKIVREDQRIAGLGPKA